MTARPFYFLTMVAIAIEAQAASLKPETLDAWTAYTKAADAAHQTRVKGDAPFLWTFDEPGRTAKVRNGEHLAAPFTPQNPLPVDGGLIHHWIGAMFLPGRNLEAYLEVTRDYDRYKIFYKPSVVESKAISRKGEVDKYVLTLASQKFITSGAFETEYEAVHQRLDQNRFGGITDSTRLQEIDKYGTAAEKRLPEGEGAGYLWKVHNIVRLMQQDGGLYVEMETIALSREMPGSIRFMAGPIIRRFARSSMLTSLKQTAEAVSVKGPLEVTANQKAGAAPSGDRISR